MARRAIRGASLPHDHYGLGLSKMPETYVPPEPFLAYRAWNWTANGIASLNGALWTPKTAFEATCRHADNLRSMQAASLSETAKKFWDDKAHHVPDPGCTCGMYAGINMRHLLDIGYVQRGIHGEVHLWGRLYHHTLGWRAQFAYPKSFVVPTNMIPVRAEEALRRLATLVEFGVDIYIQPEREARVGQQTIPLWVPDYGYSAQGTEFLIERWSRWNSAKVVHAPLAVGDRVAVFSDVNVGGIGVVKEIDGDEMFYTLFNQNVIYHKPIKDVFWDEPNWRWETSGLGSMRKVERETTPRSVLR